MDERLQFVARRLAGEAMAELCREFGISRKTGYKIFDRYQECGIHGLTDRSRRPYRYANQLPFQVENFILNVRHEHPSWGARKIRDRLLRRFTGIPIPAKSTIHAVLDRHGLVERRGRVRRRAQGTPLSVGQQPNELWCTDYKGEFLLGNHQYCYPLTVTDHASRFLLTCEALSSTREDYAFTVFERLFKERGLPANIRSDNGVPFASAHALFNLSRLAVWWLRLGIGIERMKPGHPQQNGRHERLHLTLKKEATKPAAANFLQQQARFDKFIDVFNNERPAEHEMPGGGLSAFSATIHRLAGSRLSLPRQNHRGHPLRPHLLGQEKNQLQPGLCWTSRGHQRSARRHLAGQLYGL
jgi:transposase InsO family protein